MADPDLAPGVRIGLSAVVFALIDRTACVLTVTGTDGQDALPFGPFDPERDRTFELALRAFVSRQTGFRLGFVEQLYTFGDLGRATPGPHRRREVSVGYLALTRDVAPPPSAEASWTPVLDFFPWEDRRDRPRDDAALLDALDRWAGGDAQRAARIDALFARHDRRWDEGRVLERFELLYEAGLVAEAARDGDLIAPADAPGRAMASDHRRILATGLGRLRSKLKYRPVLFDLAPDEFTLSQLQAAAEAVTGLSLHKQNFRRGVERTGLVQPTGVRLTGAGGRPAELYRLAADADVGAHALLGEAMGLPLPAQR